MGEWLYDFIVVIWLYELVIEKQIFNTNTIIVAYKFSLFN